MDIAIADDNIAEVRMIKEYLLKFQAEETDASEYHILEFTSADELLKYKDNIDLLFLDIEFGEVKGTDIVDQIRQKHSKQLLVVFISAYSAYVSNTYRADAFGFLVKPITQKKFYMEFRRCLQWYKDNQDVFVRASFGEPIEIVKSKVVYLEAHKRMIQATMCDGQVC